MDIGIRALRDSLSSQLDAVRRGAAITVTDRGRAIARIVPVNEDSPYDRLVLAGIITPPQVHRAPLEAPVLSDGIVSDLLAEQRR